ncbi:unnamed protein product, partial [Mycena citricolor]
LRSVFNNLSMAEHDALGLQLAYEQAKKGYQEGGIPIGSAIIDTSTGAVVGQGRNQRIQKGSATLHGEMDALEKAGRLEAAVYRKTTLYTTLSPCSMCTGAILLYKIPRVVIAENVNFLGGDDLLRANGVEVVVLNDEKCKDLMSQFIKEKPQEWNEDIGEIP